jgi:hypothetical protein
MANNRGLRVRVAQLQPPGEGPLIGLFELLNTGTNRHAEALQSLLGRMTDASQVLQIIRQGCPACVSVVNRRLLACHEDD